MDERRPALDVHTPADDARLTPLLDALLDDCEPFAIEDLAPSRRRVHFFSAQARDAAARVIGSRFGPDGVSTRPVDVPHGNWAARSQANLRAVRVGGIVVAPPWDVPDAARGDTVVVIRPSMGFGTGHHPSTRLCLRALEALPLAGRSVLDLGTGSGVLAILAALHGARPVFAIDNDSDAAATARANAALNGVERCVEVRCADARTGPLPAAAVTVANIHAALACQAAGRLADLVIAGGALVVGGITGADEDAVRRALAPCGAPEARYAEGGWVALTIRRR